MFPNPFGDLPDQRRRTLRYNFFSALLLGVDDGFYGDDSRAEIIFTFQNASNSALGRLIYISRASQIPGNSSTEYYIPTVDDNWRDYQFLVSDYLATRLPGVNPRRCAMSRS